MCSDEDREVEEHYHNSVWKDTSGNVCQWVVTGQTHQGFRTGKYYILVHLGQAIRMDGVEGTDQTTGWKLRPHYVLKF